MGVFSELDMEMRENGVSFAGENPFAETKPVTATQRHPC